MGKIKFVLYVVGLIASMGVWLPILHIGSDFFDAYSIYFTTPLWIVIIALIFIKRYENRKTEREMMKRVIKEETNE